MSADQQTAIQYYRNPNVRTRILEYCGAPNGEAAGAVYVAGLHEALGPFPGWDRPERHPSSAIEVLWASGCDIARSMWDRRDLIFLIEIDYENIDQPAEPFLRPADVLLKLEPAYRAVMGVLGLHRLRPYALATGRGYQFTGRVPLRHRVVDRLAALVPAVPGWHATIEERLAEGIRATMTARHARAFVGLGMIVEYIAHLVMAEVSESSVLPVVFNGTVVGSGRIGRECVSIDFSYAGDPLDIRHCRAAFSTYQWHRLRPDIFGGASRTAPPLVTLPRGPRSLLARLLAGRGLSAGARLASRSRAVMPEIAVGLQAFVDEYAASRLAAFHREYYRELHALDAGPSPIEADVATDPGRTWPPCLVLTFGHPNDLLLKPEHIQHAVRLLMARGRTPAAIARMVRAAYQADHAWGDRWTRTDAAARAEFDVRVFAGMIATGLDSLVDFNCVSAQEKDICPRVGCPFDLRDDARILKMSHP